MDNLTIIQSLSRYLVCSSCSIYSVCPVFCRCVSSTFVVNKQHIISFLRISVYYDSHCFTIIICPIAMAYSMGQINLFASVTVCVSVCPSAV